MSRHTATASAVSWQLQKKSSSIEYVSLSADWGLTVLTDLTLTDGPFGLTWVVKSASLLELTSELTPFGLT
jgi:hypothetical protein